MKSFAQMPAGMKVIVATMALIAVIAVVAVALTAWTGIGENDESGNGEIAAIERILTLGSTDESDIDVRLGSKHSDYPADMPQFDGRIIASIRSLSLDGLGFILLYETRKSPAEVLDYFEKFVTDKRWEIRSATRSEDSGGIQFVSQQSDIQGIVNMGPLDPRNAKDDRYSVVVSVTDRTKGETPPEFAERKFDPSQSQPIPQRYPANRVPAYTGATVTSSGFFQQPQGDVYFLTLVTKDGQDKVIQFYQDQLQRAGWTVDRPLNDAASIELNFTDPARASTEGTIQTSVFLRDTSYTEINIQFSIGSGLATPTPAATIAPTPAATSTP